MRAALVGLVLAMAFGSTSAAIGLPSNSSPDRPDRFCSESERLKTIAAFETRVADWREALADAEAMRSAAAANAARTTLARLESELRIVRAAPTYHCAVPIPFDLTQEVAAGG